MLTIRIASYINSHRLTNSMKKQTLPRPTDGELAILNVLWGKGPSTVREVHQIVGRAQKTGYTTILKLMQIMIEKGLVTRDESQQAHVYTAVLSEHQTQRHFMGDLLKRVFSGSAKKLVMHALAAKKTSAEELAEIRKLLDDLDKPKKGT